MAINLTDNLFVQRSPYSRTDYVRIDGATLFNIANNIQSGAKMLFMQPTAPLGWTQDTTKQNSLVSVTGGGGGGTFHGTVNASVFHNPAYSYNLTVVGPLSFGLGGTTLTTTELPSHGHSGGGLGCGGSTTKAAGGWNQAPGGCSGGTTSTGGNGAHFHAFTGSSFSVTSTLVTSNFDVAYAEAIQCVRN